MGWDRVLKARRGGEIAIETPWFAIGKTLAFGVEHLPSRRFKNGLPGGGIPFHGGSHARVKIGVALGDRAEFQR